MTYQACIMLMRPPVETVTVFIMNVSSLRLYYDRIAGSQTPSREAVRTGADLKRKERASKASAASSPRRGGAEE